MSDSSPSGHVPIAPLSPSYVHARRAFLRAAAVAGAHVTSHPHPLTGLEDEPLFVDVAEVGPGAATSVVVVVSGTHGVEGYLGSALQRHHLENRADFDTGPAFIFIHALNPHGFSWVRRVNEDNVDLNRNFIDWSQPPPTNPEYGGLADILVPGSWTEEEQARTRVDFLAKLTELGMERAQQIVSGGQFDHPTGLFYGGTEPTWSNRWLTSFVEQQLTRFERASIIDVHTGLGPWGHAELISSEDAGSTELARQRSWWDNVTAIGEDSSVSAQLTGDWLGAVGPLAPATELTAIAIEYGTVDQIMIVDSLRADAVLHATGMQTSPGAAAIRAQVRAAFADDDPAWLQTCWPSYETTYASAVTHLS